MVSAGVTEITAMASPGFVLSARQNRPLLKNYEAHLRFSQQPAHGREWRTGFHLRSFTNGDFALPHRSLSKERAGIGWPLKPWRCPLWAELDETWSCCFRLGGVSPARRLVRRESGSWLLVLFLCIFQTGFWNSPLKTELFKQNKEPLSI